MPRVLAIWHGIAESGPVWHCLATRGLMAVVEEVMVAVGSWVVDTEVVAKAVAMRVKDRGAVTEAVAKAAE